MTEASFSTDPGHEGQYLGTTQTVGDQTVSLTQKEAVSIIGAKAFSEAQGQAATPNRAAYFSFAMASDIAAHPWMYAAHVAGVAAGPVLGLPVEVEGLITAVHALHTAADLQKEMEGRQ